MEGSVSSVERLCDAPLHLAVQNADVLLQVYGADVLNAIGAELLTRVRPLLDGVQGGSVAWLGDGRLALYGFGDCAHERNSLIERALIEVCSKPVRLNGEAIAISLSVLAGYDEPHYCQPETPRRQFNGGGSFAGYSARDHFISDMRRAADVLEAISDGGVCSLLQPIAAEAGGERTLFYECHHYLSGMNWSRVLTPMLELLPLMRRLGLMRYIDRVAVAETVSRLKENRGLVLVCSLSAASAICDAWWQSVFKELESDRKLACRLIVNISGLAGSYNVKSAISFVSCLKNLGCCVAIDYPGNCPKSLAFLAGSRLDIIFVNSNFLDDGGIDIQFEKLEEQMDVAQILGIFRYLVPCIVASGVDTPDVWRSFRRLGVEWFQGAYIGQPNFSAGLLECDDSSGDMRVMRHRILPGLEAKERSILERIVPAIGEDRIAGGWR